MMSSLSPSDDYRHTLKPGEHEAFYFLFTSMNGEVFGFVRTLFGSDDVLEMVALRTETGAWGHQRRAAPADAASDSETEAAGPSLRLACIEPWRSWHCFFRGAVQASKGERALEVDLDLSFAASGDPHRYRFGPYQQVQQDGRLSGRLRIGEETRTGELLCYRDHSWGTRPMGTASGWTVACVPDRLYVAVIETQNGKMGFGRFTADDGASMSVSAPDSFVEGGGLYIEDTEAGLEPWLARRMAPPLVSHLGPAGHEALRSERKPGDLLRDEISPAIFTSPEGERLIGFLEQARSFE